MGAVTVLSMAPAIPPRVKSRRKDEDVVGAWVDDAWDIFFIVVVGDGARFGTETFALMREGSEFGHMVCHLVASVGCCSWVGIQQGILMAYNGDTVEMTR